MLSVAKCWEKYKEVERIVDEKEFEEICDVIEEFLDYCYIQRDKKWNSEEKARVFSEIELLIDLVEEFESEETDSNPFRLK